jgi:murein L,D-transpeptidase YcbB/YkuD
MLPRKIKLQKVSLAVLVFTFIGFLPFPLIARGNANIRFPTLVMKYYKSTNFVNTWYSPFYPGSLLRREFVHLLDSCEKIGLDRNDYHYDALVQLVDEEDIPDSTDIAYAEALFTDALISVSIDAYRGAHIEDYIRNDEVGPKSRDKENDSVVAAIVRHIRPGSLAALVTGFEPVSPEYKALKAALTTVTDSRKARELVASINLYRWMFHDHFQREILVNIASGLLYYYEHDSVLLQMEVVAGKPATKTPRLGTWCYQVVLYPYWNVPEDIGRKELLAKCKKDIHSKSLQEMQLVSRTGKVFSLSEVNFSQYNKRNFPYTFRQETGCDNALGVIKFELSDPFSIYLHDTNFKNAFLSAKRYFSHGCVRIQKPLELANCLLNNTVDSNLLKACYKNMEPIILKVEPRVPVFLVYMPAWPVADSIVYFNDVYHLF